MKSIKRGLAVFLAVLLMMPNLPVAAEEAVVPDAGVAQQVTFNTGEHAWNIGSGDVSGNTVSDSESYDDVFAGDGSYTINIPELNPFFPYEVQFTCDGEVTNQWFMSPDDTVEVGGHTFHVAAYFDNTAVTQMSLNVAGNTVVVYPEEKEFTNDDSGIALMSLLPLEEKHFSVDLSAFTPVELTQVAVTSVFAGENAVADTDKIVWNTTSDDKYTISSSADKLDLSKNTYYGGTNWEMIVGAADQLAADNTRYIVNISTKDSESWLVPTAYTQDSAGTRTAVNVSRNEYYDYNKDERELSLTLSSAELGENDQIYLSLGINPEVYASTGFDHLRVFDGKFTTAAEVAAATDITAQIYNVDMTQANAGYALERYTESYVTMVSYDAANQITGILPFYLYYSTSSDGMSMYGLIQKTGEYDTQNVQDMSRATYNRDEDCRYYTKVLYKEFPANGTYYQKMNYRKAGTTSNEFITAAYVGLYGSIAAATEAGAADIKATLTGNDGYPADYSQGVYFTIFVGADGAADQQIYRYNIKTETGENSYYIASSGTSLNFTGLMDGAGNTIAAYSPNSNEDSYAEYNYLTMLVGEDVDLTHVAPTFWTSSGVNLYTAGSSTKEISGQSYHDFSNGPVQYTAAAEDGKNSGNYWLQIVKAKTGAGQLYVNSFADPDAHTRTENNVVYSTREVMLDGYHNDVHDIWMANMGTEAISGLTAEISSSVVELDDYWTLKGVYNLAGFTTAEKTTNYGELSNLCKVRLKAKDGVEAGTDVSGTLTIKSGDTALMVLTLTGTIGNPTITTKEVPQAVKYVPYGSMIQNSNKYSWNTVSYELLSGELPLGMTVKENGELYGVPKTTGDFTFTVRMNNSYNSFPSVDRTFTLTVIENTDVNVNAATDTGYDVTQRVQQLNMNAQNEESYTMVSQGVFVEFVDIYLDGEKLVKGTDYNAESGSTRITILTQTLTNVGAGTHTLGVEFRTQDTDTLKKAAQNYAVVTDGSGNGGGNNDGGNDNGNDGGNDDGGNDNGGSNNAGSAATGTAATAAGTVEGATATSYTIASGDTLWKIAEKFYGSGEYWQKIFADNAGIITDANKIYAGQKINIYPITAGKAAAGSQTANQEGTYTVQSGDNLWKIARKVLGFGWKWRELYEANADTLSDPGKLRAGQTLVIPK